jgi:hypothetical protein
MDPETREAAIGVLSRIFAVTPVKLTELSQFDREQMAGAYVDIIMEIAEQGHQHDFRPIDEQDIILTTKGVNMRRVTSGQICTGCGRIEDEILEGDDEGT